MFVFSHNYPLIFTYFHVEGPKDANLSNDVFEDFSSGDDDQPEEEVSQVSEEIKKTEVY